jgi:hypothetical protein
VKNNLGETSMTPKLVTVFILSAIVLFCMNVLIH